MNAAIAILLAATLVLYWSYCRRVSLKHREKASDMIAAFINDDEISEKEKESIYWSYMASRHWLFMPAMAVVTPIVLACMLITRGPEAESIYYSDQYNKIMDSLMKMYITRNPATGIICMIVTFSAIAISAAIGMLLNRMRSIPSIESVYGSVATRASHADVKHAH